MKEEEKKGLTNKVGPFEIEWPQTIGYYGGIGLAIALELIDPPLALFIAAIPLIKMLRHPKVAQPARFVGQVLEGAAHPVGGAADATIQLSSEEEEHLEAEEEQQQQHKKKKKEGT